MVLGESGEYPSWAGVLSSLDLMEWEERTPNVSILGIWLKKSKLTTCISII